MKASVFVAALTMAGALLAQPPVGGFRRDPNATPPTPQQMIQREVNRLTRFLTLSTDQQTQITNILSADISNLTSLQANLKTERAAVLTAIKSNSGVAAAVSALSATQAQVETIRANEAALIYTTVLTADQKTKVGDAVQMLSGGGGPGPGRGFGPPR